MIRNAQGENVTSKLNIKKVDGSITVEPRPVTVTTGTGSKVYDGTALTNSDITVEGIVEGETYEAYTTGSQTEADTSNNTYTIVWAAEDNEYTAKASNYTVTDSLGTLTVTEYAD